MVRIHKLVKLEQHTSNFPQYQWYVECSCGFQARVGQEIHAQSQFNAHLQYHGCDTMDFSAKEKEEEVKEVVLDDINKVPTP